MQRTLNERLQVVRLMDAYGRLLTTHQQQLLRLYYQDDLSLSEIAQRAAVTRQAVFDSLRRSVVELQRMEDVLQVVRDRDDADRRRAAVTSHLQDLRAAIDGLQGQVQRPALSRLTMALDALRRAAR